MDVDDQIAAFRQLAEKPLPVRIDARRIFWGIFLEAFCVFMRGRSFLESLPRFSLENDSEDIRHAAKDIQLRSAEDGRKLATLFAIGMGRRGDRMGHERYIFTRAVRCGYFLGMLCCTLPIQGGLLLLFSGERQKSLMIGAAILITQLLVWFVCRKGWHYNE